ncbi:MAG: membrane protein insertion efficiency factor YidD [Bacteroidia bacterium]
MQRSFNPIKVFLYIPLYLYQKFLSEQISAGCEFDRSCSNYSIAAIKEFGFLKGIFLTADRLTRCNGQAQAETQSYLINHSNGKVIDEPSMYHFKD